MKRPVYTMSSEFRDRLIDVLERAERAIAWEADHRRRATTYTQAEALYDLADDVTEIVHALNDDRINDNVIPFPTGGGAA